ncbi:unnamed protein product [Polarella glacialis]|uniref:Uncharacterized protein n=1 Tax=Polarella glacialis TaxID=89957 RepID=A0A813EPK0_POLGL|nr:unnamed protein product [Polarella glacialis]
MAPTVRRTGLHRWAIAAAVAAALAATKLSESPVAWAATKELPATGLPEPLRPEAVAALARKLGGKLLQLAAFPTLPARALLAGGEATLLLPLGRRLQAAATAAPTSATAAMEKACSTLEIRFPCPTLLVLESKAEESLLQTLPLGPPHKRRYGVFASRGLLARASSKELFALLLREVALLRMHSLQLPEVWAWWEAAKPLPVKVRGVVRKAHSKTKSPSSGSAEAILQTVLAQLGELCRLHHGLQVVAAGLHQLPKELSAPLLRVTGQVRLRQKLLGDAADVVAVRADEGNSAAMREAAVHAAEFAERRELKSVFRTMQLFDEVGMGKPKSSLKENVKGGRQFMDFMYKVGPHRVEGLMTGVATVRRPQRLVRNRQSKKKLPYRALLTAFASLRRAVELAADRQAAEAAGGIEPVVGGLILLYGTPSEQRRLKRGDVAGLIEDAHVDFPPNRRWAYWWQNTVKAKLRPTLQLRIAELADWAESKALKKTVGGASDTWSGWARAKFHKYVY